MPIYEYECQACGHHYEIKQQMSDPPLTTCEHCHQPELEKLISATSFQLKGGGWYAEGYAASKPKDTAAANTEKSSTPATTTTNNNKSASSSSNSSSSAGE